MIGEAEAAVVVACLLQRSSKILISRWLFARIEGRPGRESSRSDPFSWPKLTPRTASGDPPEGMVALAFVAAPFSFQTSTRGEFRSDAHRR